MTPSVLYPLVFFNPCPCVTAELSLKKYQWRIASPTSAGITPCVASKLVFRAFVHTYCDSIFTTTVGTPCLRRCTQLIVAPVTTICDTGYEERRLRVD